MRAPLFLISILLSSAGCSQPDEMASDVGVDREAESTATAAPKSATAEATGAGGAENFEDNEERDGGSREFTYSWPGEVGADAPLAALLRDERSRLLAEQEDEWETALADSPADCVSCRSRSMGKEWKVVTDLPQWLSLSAETHVYTGGAHGMSGMESLVWNKADQRRYAGSDLFKSPVALENALGQRLCDSLNRERGERRGQPVRAGSNGMFDNCPGIDESTVLIGSSNGETFDRLTIYFGPYVAGPYAEGAFELDFPVTASVIDAVKPRFASAFSVGR